MPRRYFQMATEGSSAEILIYGDITSWPWLESDVSSWTLSKALAALPEDVTEVTVRINSYGGEVAEGIAIYNALRAHPAHVTTVCDAFACSIASVVFMAGDERVMNEASLLMIHNAWMRTAGDAADLRKDAEDLDTITEMSKRVYRAATDLSDEELAEWMDRETFIDSETAYARGFCTAVESIADDNASQGAAMTVRDMLMACMALRDRLTACEPPVQGPEPPEPPVQGPEPPEPPHEAPPEPGPSMLETFARAIASK